MKLLFYRWASYFDRDLEDVFREKGISYDTFTWKFEDKNTDEQFEAWFDGNVELKQYDVLFSVNYWPLLSKVCQQNNVKYIAWCYDNPLNVRDIHLYLANPCNYVFCFDRNQMLGYRRQGYQTVYHMPLGVNATRLAKVDPASDRCVPYRAQVGFVGKLYESALYQILSLVNDYTKGYLQATLNAQQNVYGAYFLDEIVTEELINDINAQFLAQNPDTKLQLIREELIYALSCEVTRRDRLILLNLCGRRFQTKFYSYNDSEVIRGVEKCPSVNYWDEMPWVFAASRINLNPCFRAIQTGIPLRALDIMGCGGFLLSNYQEELAELYQNEDEMVVYESLEDAVDKIQFYLEHEELRAGIARKGRVRTLTDYSMQNRVEEILRQVL